MDLAKNWNADIRCAEFLRSRMRNQLRPSVACAAAFLVAVLGLLQRASLPQKTPTDEAWLNPFVPLTTEATRAAAAACTNSTFTGMLPLRAGLAPDTKMTVNVDETNVAQALVAYAELTGRTLLPRTSSLRERMDEFFGGRLSRWHLVNRATRPETGITYHGDGRFSAEEVKDHLEELFKAKGIRVVPQGKLGLKPEYIQEHRAR